MCIFAGCDFLKALPGIGMKKAHQHVKRLKAHRKVQDWLMCSTCFCAALIQRHSQHPREAALRFPDVSNRSGCTIMQWVVTECACLHDAILSNSLSALMQLPGKAMQRMGKIGSNKKSTSI